MADEDIPAAEVPQWVLIQKKTFTKWMNGHLKKKSHPMMADPVNEFETGTNLMNLINALYDIPVPKHNRTPKMRPHKLDNCELALKMLSKEAQVKTNFLGTMHLVDHDLKMILGMVWAIILDYQIKGISVDDLSAKEGLLLWVQQKTKGYNGVDVKNFTESFSDGLAFCALIHKFRPDLLDYDQLSKGDADKNLELAFDIAERELQIPRLLDVEDMKNPDDKSVMTYVSEYYHRLSEYEKGLAYHNKVKQFINLVKNLTELRDYYGFEAPRLVSWVDLKTEELSNMNYKDDLDTCKNELNKLAAYWAGEKSDKIGVKFTLQGKYQNAQALIKANNMAPYVTPEGSEPEVIDAKWDELERIEAHRASTLKDQLRKHFDDMFKKFDKDKSGRLNLNEFKALITSLGYKLSDAEIDNLFAKATTEKDGQKAISFDDFLEFMMEYISTTDGADDVKRGFKHVSGQKDYTLEADLKTLGLNPEVLEWVISGAMPTQGDGYNYVTFVDSQF
jgi:actinin alpha